MLFSNRPSFDDILIL